MNISSNDWLNYINKLSKLNTTAGDLMKSYIEKHGFDNMDELVTYAHALVSKYGEGSAALAAEMYDELAAAQGVIVPPAEVAPTASYGETAKAMYGTVKQSLNPNSSGRTVSRLVKQAGQDTTLKNAVRDGAEFAWIPSGDTCVFCLTLASRGWQKASKAAIQGGHAEHIHASCDCAYSIRFDGKSNVKGYDPSVYRKMYDDAEGKNSKEKIKSMRRKYYEENKDKINAQKRAAYAEQNIEEVKKQFKLGAKKNGNDGESVRIDLGKIPIEKTQELVDYFKDELRNRSVENVVIIDKKGKVTQFIGFEDSVKFSGIKTDGARILHNHPISNGITSFGEDDFLVIRDNQKAIYDLCNPEYDYHLTVKKDISRLTYNDAMNMVQLNDKELMQCDDLQHEIMRALGDNGYINYERVKI